MHSIPVSRNSMEQLSVAEEKLSKVMNKLLGVDVFAKKLEMDEERFVPEGLGYKTDLFEEDDKVCIAMTHLHLSYIFNFRKRKMLKVDQRRRRFQPEDISRDRVISSWMPRVAAREEEESVDKVSDMIIFCTEVCGTKFSDCDCDNCNDNFLGICLVILIFFR